LTERLTGALGDAMADNIVDITFTNVQVQDAFSHTATITGTIEVDYTTGTVINGQLSASVNGANQANFTAFTLTPQGGNNFGVTSTSGTNGLTFLYTGQQPTSLAALGLGLPSAGLVFAGPPFANDSITSTPVCYVEGTLIRTPHGDVPVEALEVGDLVETGSGELRPVKWLGHRVIDCRAHANPRLVRPIRIAQDAFGPSRPSQDLYVSTGHSICVDLCGEVLIPASNLVNGATIAQIEVDEVSYWHVELESHDILIANNLPAESYFDHGNRGFFDESGATLEAFEGRAKTHADFCRPVVLDGPVLAFVRERLMARAEAIGWTPSHDAGLHLVVDGEVLHPLSEGGAAVFLFPADARDVRLKSNTFVPALVGGLDPRSLGVSLTGLVFSGSRGEPRAVPLDDERLQDGFHAEEAKSASPWRWTKGELVLGPDFWEGLSGHVALLVTYNNNVTHQWLAPAKPEQESRPRLYAVKSAPAAASNRAQAGR
jgi:Hint domain